jgi:adenylate kinase
MCSLLCERPLAALPGLRHHRGEPAAERSAALPQLAAELPRLLFVGGFHAAGKSTFCRALAPLLRLEHLKASALIKVASSPTNPMPSGKAVADIDANQRIVVAGVRRRMDEIRAARLPGLLLDGHFGLLQSSGGFRPIPLAVFSALAPEVLILVEAAPDEVHVRMSARVGERLLLSEIEQYVDAERAQAKLIAAHLRVPLMQVRGDLPTERETEAVAISISARSSPKDA